MKNSRYNCIPYYPINDSASLNENAYKNLDNNELICWSNFKAITRSTYIINKLLEKQNNICPICAGGLENKNTVVHHINYKQLCEFTDVHKEKRPTVKRPNRVIRVPKCNICPSSEACINKTILVHNRCHMILHKMEGRVRKSGIKQNLSLKPDAKKRRQRPIIIESSISKEDWIRKTSSSALVFVDLILDNMNSQSKGQRLQIEYKKTYIKLRPRNFIYFKPEKESVKISIALGDLLNWKKQLDQTKIKTKLSKKAKPRLSIKIVLDTYEENIDLINSVIADAVNCYNEKYF